MTPDFAITIQPSATFTTAVTVVGYINDLTDAHPALAPYRHALVDIINTQESDPIELFNIPAMAGDFVSNGTRLLWMPEIGRAALNSFQSGDWQWTDASSPEDALRRYAEDDMAP